MRGCSMGASWSRARRGVKCCCCCSSGRLARKLAGGRPGWLAGWLAGWRAARGQRRRQRLTGGQRVVSGEKVVNLQTLLQLTSGGGGKSRALSQRRHNDKCLARANNRERAMGLERALDARSRPPKWRQSSTAQHSRAQASKQANSRPWPQLANRPLDRERRELGETMRKGAQLPSVSPRGRIQSNLSGAQTTSDRSGRGGGGGGEIDWCAAAAGTLAAT